MIRYVNAKLEDIDIIHTVKQKLKKSKLFLHRFEAVVPCLLTLRAQARIGKHVDLHPLSTPSPMVMSTSGHGPSSILYGWLRRRVAVFDDGRIWQHRVPLCTVLHRVVRQFDASTTFMFQAETADGPCARYRLKEWAGVNSSTMAW